MGRFAYPGAYNIGYTNYIGPTAGMPYPAPLAVPVMSPFLAPGLAAPGIPYGFQPFSTGFTNPYYPGISTIPGLGYGW